jgi:hypothetical protein
MFSAQVASERQPARQTRVVESQIVPLAVHWLSMRQPARQRPLTQMSPVLQPVSLVQPGTHICVVELQICSIAH